MKKIIMLISILAIFVIGLGWIYYSAAGTDNEFILPDTDDDLTVTAKVDFTLNFADGTSKIITGNAGLPLTVEYDGQEVTSASYQIKAKADTPVGSEPYTEVEFNLNPSTAGYSEADFNLVSSVQYDTGDGQWRTHWTETSTASNIIRTITVDSGTYTVLYEHTITFADIFDASDNSNYGYRVKFSPMDYCIFRGAGAGGSGGTNGEWQVVAMGAQNMGCVYPIDYIDNQVTVSWDSNVIWN